MLRILAFSYLLVAGLGQSEAFAERNKLAQVHVSAADSVELGEPFYVSVQLADKEGNGLKESECEVDVSANKLNIDMPSGDLQTVNGWGGFWTKSNSWHGKGLQINAQCAPEGSPANVYIGGMSDEITVLSAGAMVAGELSQIYLGAPR